MRHAPIFVTMSDAFFCLYVTHIVHVCMCASNRVSTLVKKQQIINSSYQQQVYVLCSPGAGWRQPAGAKYISHNIYLQWNNT